MNVVAGKLLTLHLMLLLLPLVFLSIAQLYVMETVETLVNFEEMNYVKNFYAEEFAMLILQLLYAVDTVPYHWLNPKK